MYFIFLLIFQVDASTAIAARTSWETGSANSDFAVAVKKTLASGADFSVKAGVSGTVDLAHVSVSKIPRPQDSFFKYLQNLTSLFSELERRS